LKKISISHF